MVDNSTPLITLVIKSKNYVETDLLNDSQNSLIDTLSMLCSFLSVKDFCSLIFSNKFSSLMKNSLELVFEIGLYTNHEKTLELTVMKDKMSIRDLLDQGCFDDCLVEFSTFSDLEIVLNRWLTSIFNQ